MKKTSQFVRYLISSAITLVGSALFANIAHGQDISAGNSTTGADSNNQSTINIESGNSINVENEASVHNCINISSNTGNNSASKNTGNGSVSTGDASSKVTTSTTVNTVNLNSSKNSSSASVSAQNNTTGAESENKANVESKDSSKVSIKNNANIENKINGLSDTGNNTADMNTGNGSVKTGDASFSADVTNSANITQVTASGNSGSTDVTLSNTKTGFSSDNYVDFTMKKENEVDIENCADVNNEINTESNTGNNEANENTGNATIDTGDANADITTDTTVNTTAVSDTSNGSVTASLKNDITGAESQNKICLDLENENELNIYNNAKIDNPVNIVNNTGSNKANKNSSSQNDPSITTGDVNATFDISSDANRTVVSANSSSDDVTIDATNHKTGYDSNNEIEINVENEKTLDISNELNVNNEISVDANTGENNANENTGNATIDTGNIKIDGSVSTTGNIVNLTSADVDPTSVTATNDITGAESDNQVEVNIENSPEVNIENNTPVDNTLEINDNTGNNQSDENTGSGSASTGDADVALDVNTSGSMVGNGTDMIGTDDFCAGNPTSIEKTISGENSTSVIVNGDEIL